MTKKSHLVVGCMLVRVETPVEGEVRRSLVDMGYASRVTVFRNVVKVDWKFKCGYRDGRPSSDYNPTPSDYTDSWPTDKYIVTITSALLGESE